MNSSTTSNPAEIKQAFQEWDRVATIYNFRLACYLGILLMPAGVILDAYVYGERYMPELLAIRLLCSALIGVFLAVLLTTFAQKHYRVLGVALAMLPSS